MSVDGEDRRLDEKGRITIPQEIRERLDLRPGEHVRIELEGNTVVVRPRVSRSAFVESMEGFISDETRAEDAPDVGPEDVKADWTSDLPDDR